MQNVADESDKHTSNRVDALGLIKKGMEDNIKKIPGKTKIEQIQKTVLFSTACTYIA
jgi:hypothetical protein